LPCWIVASNLILDCWALQQNMRWQARRSQRLEKMQLLDLQSNLKSEIEAKQAISEQLSQSKALCLATEQYVLLRKFQSRLRNKCLSKMRL